MKQNHVNGPTQQEVDTIMKEELDEEWETELRQEELKLEKEIQLREYQSKGINLKKRFLVCAILSTALVAIGWSIKLKYPDGLRIGGTEVKILDGSTKNSKDVKEINGEYFVYIKTTTIFFYLAVLPATYFIASFIAVLIRAILSRKKENTRLLLFYFSKMQNYFIIALGGILTIASLNLFFLLWQPDHWLRYLNNELFTGSNYFKAAQDIAKLITAWGCVQLAGVILFRNFSVKFHKSAYYDRVLQVLFTEYVLVMLSRPISSPKHRKKSSDTLTPQDNAWANVKIEKVPIKEKEIMTRHVSNLRLAEFVSFLQESPYFLVHSAEHDESEKNFLSVGKNVLGLLSTPEYKKGGKARALSARKLGHRLFFYLKNDDRKYIVQQDFERHLSPQLAEEAFHLFDKNYDGSLDYREFIETVNEILKERKAISDSLNDAEKALAKLESITFACSCFIWFFVALFICGVDVQSTFVSLTSFIVGFAFLFGPVVKSIVDGILFVFVSHPFDISDRIILGDGDAKDMYTVMRLNMYNTVVKRSDNAHVVFPNGALSTMKIVNLTKSNQMIDKITFNINADTPVTKLKKMEKLFKRFLSENQQHYNDSFEISLLKCEDCLTVDVRMVHRHNFHNMKRYRERRTNAIYEMMQILEHLEIHNESLTLPIKKLN